MASLKTLDVVTWNGKFGKDAPKNVTVVEISIGNHHNKNIIVEEIDWIFVDGRDVIVILDNGHWAYGSQIKPNKTI